MSGSSTSKAPSTEERAVANVDPIKQSGHKLGAVLRELVGRQNKLEDYSAILSASIRTLQSGALPTLPQVKGLQNVAAELSASGFVEPPTVVRLFEVVVGISVESFIRETQTGILSPATQARMGYILDLLEVFNGARCKGNPSVPTPTKLSAVLHEFALAVARWAPDFRQMAVNLIYPEDSATQRLLQTWIDHQLATPPQPTNPAVVESAG